ncbi:MAG: hypothetical protein HPY74_05130 [Firmicutes bacterium]|nr:hypothetical protein [Bacillota bacterium]
MITPVERINPVKENYRISEKMRFLKGIKNTAAGIDGKSSAEKNRTQKSVGTWDDSIIEWNKTESKTITKSREAVLEIDQYEAFASVGYKNTMDLLRESAQRAYQHVMEYIGKTAEDGDRLAAIELGGNPLADIAERDAFPEKEFGIDFIPKARPKYDVKYITRMYRMNGTIAGTKVDRFI